jgi:hypothetical protein
LAALGTILKRHAKIINKSIPKMTDLGSKKGAQREPKSDPKRTKIEDKNRCEKNYLQDRLEAVLGRSWAVLWPPLGSFLLILYWFLKLFVKIHFYQTIWFQDPS